MAAPVPKIAVIGAGPGGLMLASILHHHGIPCTVYERDSSSTARKQGGTLDIHDHSGQKALDAAGLLDKFRGFVRVGGDAMRILKKDGTSLWDDNGDHEENEEQQPAIEGEAKFIRGRPEIDRQVLKDLLIASLPKDTIRWATKVTFVLPIEGSRRWKIELEDGSHSPAFDLVVGADGAWSRTRRLLTDQQPFFSGITALDVWLDRVDETAPDVSAFIGLGNCFMWDENSAFLFQRSGQGRGAQARCFGCVKTDSKTPPTARELLGLGDDGGETEEIDWADGQTREKFVERHFGNWFPEAKRIFLAMTDKPALRPLYMLPVGLTWVSQPGLTLLGDAAHLMTPFAGVGVNTAMMDALELADGIVNCVKAGRTGSDSLAAMLHDYEKGMFARSGKEAAKTDAAMRLQFQPDGAERMIAVMSNGLGPENAKFE